MLPWNPPSSFSSNIGSTAAPTSDPSGSGSGFFNAQQQQQQGPNTGQQAWRTSFGQDRSGPSPQQQQQQQQQTGGIQQQQGLGAGGAAGHHAGGANAFQQQQQQQPMTLASVLHFLQTEHRRYAKDRNEWEIERAEMRARIALLEGEKRGNEGALRDLARRCKMLENALRGERSKFLSTKDALSSQATHSPSPSGTSSPVPLGPAAVAAASGVAPAKAAHILSTLHPPSSKDGKDGTGTLVPPAATTAGESATMAASTSTSGAHAPAKPGANGPVVNGTWPNAAATTTATGGLLSSARDPRGKARSRDYLKQCLQEITYLTSATTLNPLSASSQAAPNVQRPRKVLPDHVPATGPGVINLPNRSASTAELGSSSIASMDSAGSTNVSAPAKSTPAPVVSAPSTNASMSQAPSSTSASAQSITKYPSDPASAFVPLKRTISQPGVPGSAGFASTTTRGSLTPSTAVNAVDAGTRSQGSDEQLPESKEPGPGSLASLAKDALNEAHPTREQQESSTNTASTTSSAQGETNDFGSLELATESNDPFLPVLERSSDEVTSALAAANDSSTATAVTSSAEDDSQVVDENAPSGNDDKAIVETEPDVADIGGSSLGLSTTSDDSVSVSKIGTSDEPAGADKELKAKFEEGHDVAGLADGDVDGKVGTVSVPDESVEEDEPVLEIKNDETAARADSTIAPEGTLQADELESTMTEIAETEEPKTASTKEESEAD
ncbi:hypothetical protein ACM66B_006514 [Microbotryomycetes sp. NB124-2]